MTKTKPATISKRTQVKARAAGHVLGRNFQEGVIGFLTCAAGVAANDAVLTAFGGAIFMALFLKERIKRKGARNKFYELFPYVLFVVGYIGGGYNFVESYFRPDMQMKAFLGLGILAFAQAFKLYYEKIAGR